VSGSGSLYPLKELPVADEPKRSILLVDDKQANLDGLSGRIEAILADTDVEVRTWVPTGDEDPEAAFRARVDKGTVLVVTDYDLTPIIKGLFGLSIVGWCQTLSIPVGDFSRGNVAALPKEPNLFELRVPAAEEEGAAFIATTFRGFDSIRRGIVDNPGILTERRSLASVLGALLDRSRLESQFAAYMTRLGAANSSLLQQLREFAGPEVPDMGDKVRLLTYVLGHVLQNAILKYPGPILSVKALCAYLATTEAEVGAVTPLFAAAEYKGPFGDGTKLFWRDDVDDVLDGLGGTIKDEQFESFADYNRRAVEVALGRSLANHDCDRCGGVKGGFWCPFTQRPVCERANCSVPASSWIPQGAQLTRVERGFYDEWAPLLGL